MRKTIIVFVACAAIAAVAAIWLGCSEVEKAVSASPDVPCGRFCLKCTDCKGQGTSSMYKDFIDTLCTFDQVGVVCQEACQKASGLVPDVNLDTNVQAIEKETGKQVNASTFTCDDFAYGVMTGDLNGPCARFCKKCVECAATAAAASTAEWCAKEDGIVCAKACESEFVTYVTDFENIAKSDTGIQSLNDLNCNDWSATANKAGAHP